MLTAANIKRWSRDEYYRLAEQGWFDGQRAELVEGEIITMSPQKRPHYATLSRIARILGAVFGDGFFVQTQAPLALSDESEPEPDVAVIRGKESDFLQSHPTTAELIVEVSDTTRAYDLGDKAGLYAKHRIPEYWVVDMIRRQLHIHLQPRADDRALMGHSYGDVTVLSAAQSVIPLAKPGQAIDVSALLP